MDLQNIQQHDFIHPSPILLKRKLFLIYYFIAGFFWNMIYQIRLDSFYLNATLSHCSYFINDIILAAHISVNWLKIQFHPSECLQITENVLLKHKTDLLDIFKQVRYVDSQISITNIKISIFWQYPKKNMKLGCHQCFWGHCSGGRPCS